MTFRNLTLAAIALTASAATTAMAAPVSDIDYLQASRCRGIAAGLGVDAAQLSSFLRAEGRTRAPYIVEKGDEEFARAKRQTKGEAKPRMEAELAGACGAFTGAAAGQIAQGPAKGAVVR